MIRILYLVILLTILAGLALQNLTPSISLVFLGLRSQPMPLGYWLLAAVGVGIAAGIVLLVLLGLWRYFTQRSRFPESPRFKVNPPPPPDTRRPEPVSPEPEPINPDDTWTTSTTKGWGDWDTGAEVEEPEEPIEPRRDQVFEVEQQPKSGFRTGSSYSYSYRDQNQQRPGVGQRESVIDADYRELTPPYRQPNPVDEDLDFGFDDDEDF